ncbi:MAG: OmpA family protein [Chitinophagaceae bacterium]
MSFNLLETVKGYFNSGLVSTAASSLGESEGSIQKALTGAIPSILAGLLGKAYSPAGASGILEIAKQTAGSGILGNPGAFAGNDNSSLLGKGAEILKTVLGDKVAGISSLLSNFSGIKNSSASAVLSMVAPVALGSLGKHATENNLNETGLISFLSSQKSAILNALPAGLSAVAGMLGLGSVSGTVSAASGNATETAHKAAHYAEHTAEKTSGSMKFLLPLFLAVLAVALSIYLFKGCGGSPVHDAVITEDTSTSKTGHAAETVVPKSAENGRELFKVKLPNDTIIDAYKGGIEDKLVTFLGTDYKKLGEDSLKKVWFDFDNLNFETGSARITTESQVQVNNIAAILKAFPSVTLKIGGYTDKVGEEAANKKLSDARAKSVQAALAAAGVGKQITGAEGYGSAYAVYAADALESDRVKDRHVSVSVR